VILNSLNKQYKKIYNKSNKSNKLKNKNKNRYYINKWKLNSIIKICNKIKSKKII
jgi:hypothetical protein